MISASWSRALQTSRGQIKRLKESVRLPSTTRSSWNDEDIYHFQRSCSGLYLKSPGDASHSCVSVRVSSNNGFSPQPSTVLFVMELLRVVFALFVPQLQISTPALKKHVKKPLSDVKLCGKQTPTCKHMTIPPHICRRPWPTKPPDFATDLEKTLNICAMKWWEFAEIMGTGKNCTLEIFKLSSLHFFIAN